MRRTIAPMAFCLAFCIVGMIFAAIGVPLTNGTFDTGLNEWSIFPDIPEVGAAWDPVEQAAVLMPYLSGGDIGEEEEIPDTNSVLSQVFQMPANADKLSFDIKMKIDCIGIPETDVLSVTLGGGSIYQLTSSNVYNAAMNNDPNIIDGDYDDVYVYWAQYSINVVRDVSGFSGDNVELKFNLHSEHSDGCESTVLLDNIVITEVDRTAPIIAVGGMTELWPPNHKYHTFSLSDCVSVTDDVDGQMDVNLLGRIVSIYSDEPEEVQGNGDGNTYDDIVILSNSSFKVRSERQGTSNGRVYGVTFEIADEAGNIAQATFYLGVPHDQSGDPPVNDGAGAGYTVIND